MTKLENLKNGQIPENKKKMLNLMVSKPENHNLRRKTAVEIEVECSRKKKPYFIADTRLQVDQINRKKEAKFNKPLFI